VSIYSFHLQQVTYLSFLGSSHVKALHQWHHTRLCTNLRTTTLDKGKCFEIKTWSNKSLCYFRIWRRSVPWTGILLYNSWFRNVCDYDQLRTVRACTASWYSEEAESWNHAGAEQTQRTADIWWHTRNDLHGHGCVRWGNWIGLNFALRVIDRSSFWWMLLFWFNG
jgi:hypothetical protein